MDGMDRRILSRLRRNGRASAAEISREVHLSVPAVSERIRKLEQLGVIEGYTVRVSRAAEGLGLLAFVQVVIEHTAEVAAFRAAAVAEPCVLECHHMAGGCDYLLKVLVRDAAALERFLMERLKVMPGVLSSNTMICLSTLKEESGVGEGSL